VTFNTLCLTLFSLIFGAIFVFNGYTFFRLLLPLLGIVFGFILGMQTMFLIFGVGLFATVTSVFAGVFLGLTFGALSYLFFKFAIAILAGSLGYGIGFGLMQWIGLGPGFVTWMVAVILGGLLIFLTFKYKLEKYVIVVETALFGSAIIVSSLLSGSGSTTVFNLFENPVREFLAYSPLWAILFVLTAAAGIFVQTRMSNFKNWTEPLTRDPIRDYDPMDFNRS